MVSVVHMDQSNGKVVFDIIGVTKFFKLSENILPVVYREYIEEELYYLVKCIYAYLAQRSVIFIQDLRHFHYLRQTAPSGIKRLASSMSEKSNLKFRHRYRSLHAS